MSKSKRKINLNDLSKAQTASVAAAAEPEVKTVEVAQPVQKIKPELDADTRAKRQAAADAEPVFVKNLEEVAKPAPKLVAPEVRNMANLMSRTDDAIERVKKDQKENVMKPLKEKLIKEIEKKSTEQNEKDLAAVRAESGKDALTAALDVDNSEEDALLAEATALPAQGIRNELSNTKMDLTASVEEDDEMKSLLREIDEDDDDEEEEKVTEDLSKLTDEEQKIADEWEKKAITTYRESLKKKLVTSGRVEKENGELKIAKAPISVSRALRNANTAIAHTASFPLIHTGRMITMQSLTGDEIPTLDARSYNSDMEAARAMYSLMYKKDVSPNKPSTFEVWLKSICDWDIFNLYMCLYVATFKDSNYISYTCPECHNMFVTEQPIEAMYRKHPDATKDFDARIDAIKTKGDNAVPSVLKSNLVQISRKFAIGLRAPSIFSSTFETAALDVAFRRKHIQCVNLAQYVDGVYTIENGIATPINFKVDQHNTSKTVKMKIVSLERIISTLTTDEAAALSGTIASFNQKANDRYQFVIPATDCHGTFGPYKDAEGKSMNGKECHYKIPEIVQDRGNEVTPLDLLFTRHRLTQFAFYETEL